MAGSGLPRSARTRSSPTGISTSASSGLATGRSPEIAGWRPLTRLALQQRHRLHPEGLAHPVQDGGQRPLAAQHAARRRREQLGLGAGPGCLFGPPGRRIHYGADREPDRYEDEQREGVVDVGDGEHVDGRREVVVEQQRACHRGDHRGDEAPHERYADHTSQEDQDVAGEIDAAAHIRQGQREQRRQGHGEGVAGQLATAAQRAAACSRQGAAAADIGVRHHVHVDVA